MMNFLDARATEEAQPQGSTTFRTSKEMELAVWLAPLGCLVSHGPECRQRWPKGIREAAQEDVPGDWLCPSWPSCGRSLHTGGLLRSLAPSVLPATIHVHVRLEATSLQLDRRPEVDSVCRRDFLNSAHAFFPRQASLRHSLRS